MFLANFPFFFSVWYLYETRFASFAVLGVIYGVSQLITILFEIPTGYIADRWGRRNAAVFGYLLQAISWFIVGNATGMWSIWIGYLVNGTGMAFVSGAVTALDYDSLKQDGRSEEFAKWTSRGYVLANIAVLIAIIAGGYISEISLHLTYLATAWTLVATVFCMLFVKEPSIGGHIGVSVGKSIQDFKETFSGILRNAETRVLLLYYTVVSGLSYAFIFTFALVFAIKVYPDTILRGYVIAGLCLLLAVVVGMIAQGLVKKHTVTLILWGAFCSVGYLGIGFVAGGSVWVAPIWMMLLYLSYNIRLAVVDQFINDIFPSKFRATLLSVLNLGASVIAFLALALGGRGVEKFGIEQVFLALGIVCVLVVGGYGVKIASKHLRVYNS